MNRINPLPQAEEPATIPPSYLYPWLDREPVDATPGRCRPAAGLVASIVAGGLSGAVAAVTVLMAGLV